MLPETNTGELWILTIELNPSRLNSLPKRYGVPRRVVCDNGTQILGASSQQLFHQYQKVNQWKEGILILRHN